MIVINVGISMQGKWSDHLYIGIGSWWVAFKLKKRCISIQESTTGFHLTQQGYGYASIGNHPKRRWR
jgi:hypothetical protein